MSYNPRDDCFRECDVEKCPGNSLTAERGEEPSVEVKGFMLVVVEGREGGTQPWLPAIALSRRPSGVSGIGMVPITARGTPSQLHIPRVGAVLSAEDAVDMHQSSATCVHMLGWHDALLRSGLECPIRSHSVAPPQRGTEEYTVCK